MLSPLIPNDKHPKWIMTLKILEIIGSPRARKVASRLKIYDIDNFIISIKVIILSSLFERDISSVLTEINQNLDLKTILGINSDINTQKSYNTMFDLDYNSLYSFLNRTFQVNRPKRIKMQRTIIIDTTPIIIDLNTWRNRHKIGKRDKKYKY
jgi:hypothetical protein